MTKNIKFITYYDLDRENKHGFSSKAFPPTEQTLALKEQIIPGAFGYPDMYIRYMKLRYSNQDYPIICMTDYELDETKRLEIFAGAVKFLGEPEV
ncbi:MAG: hypothetical protein RMY64_19390 [Nostoc sp. DedQUE08]|uniref:hypothetical protein n=1 Tax=unclassified Nostoc TaxID=2593658 RepID=UPI002AD4CE44|nr:MULTISPECIES: hypothetical protein [unclassified Nostoc]MDZ8067756.1 hypothetical protein [Nostoc sp. DedQUE08]MDZ8095927.1 hypothetical protein [Nostoc sp. DedQUE05]